MILTIHQPLYMPWLGFFHKMASADVIVILDDVAYSRGDYVNRNRIVGPVGSQFLTVPISAFNSGSVIKDIEISGMGWKRVHLEKIRHSYLKTKHFSDIYSGVYELLQNWESRSLVDLDLAVIKHLMEILGIKTQIILQSAIPVSGSGSNLIREISHHLKANTYISGPQGVNYLNIQDFEKDGTDLLFQKFVHPYYPQESDSFVENLSVLDLLFRFGSDALEIIMSTNSQLLPYRELSEITHGK